MSHFSPLPRTVYILGDGLLFDEVITHMLSSNAAIRVINRVYGHPVSFLIDVGSYHPDVILLNETAGFNGNGMLSLLAQISLPKDLRVILISLDDNKIQIVDRPADSTKGDRGISHTDMQITNWDEMLRLISRGQLLEFGRR